MAMNKSWHLGHFRCFTCNVSITGKQFVVVEDNAVCSDCFEQRYVVRGTVKAISYFGTYLFPVCSDCFEQRYVV